MLSILKYIQEIGLHWLIPSAAYIYVRVEMWEVSSFRKCPTKPLMLCSPTCFTFYSILKETNKGTIFCHKKRKKRNIKSLHYNLQFRMAAHRRRRRRWRRHPPHTRPQRRGHTAKSSSNPPGERYLPSASLFYLFKVAGPRPTAKHQSKYKW